MCVAGRLRTARGSLDTVFCAFRLLARRLRWVGPLSALGAWNSGSGRGASRHSFSHSPSLDFGLTLPLPVLGVSRGLQGQGQHPAKRTQLGGVLQKSFT